MKKVLNLLLITIIIMSLLVGCTDNDNNTPANSSPKNTNEETEDFDTNKTINVITREEGSGTRGAFVEIVGILEKDTNGNEVDKTYTEAIVQNSTNAVMTGVTGDKYSIGYISLGSLNNTVKAVKIDGVEATPENILDNSYKLARPFNLAYKDDLNPLAKDFIDFILSAEGQKIAEEEGYVPINTNPPSYENINEQKGSILIAGSTSVAPLMEKLVEAYQELNPEVSIDIQATGSSAGMQSAMEGTADIGMASRELKDSELAELTSLSIAVDGITVIVNKENPLENLSIDELKSIYIGEITKWNEVIK